MYAHTQHDLHSGMNKPHARYSSRAYSTWKSHDGSNIVVATITTRLSIDDSHVGHHVQVDFVLPQNRRPLSERVQQEIANALNTTREHMLAPKILAVTVDLHIQPYIAISWYPHCVA